MSAARPEVNLGARIHPDAKFAFLDSRLALRQAGCSLQDREVADRLCLGLGEKHIQLVLAHALGEVSLEPAGAGMTVNFAARVSKVAKLTFDAFALDFYRSHPLVQHDYQVVQGLCLALSLPYVRAVLDPWMRR